MPRCSVATASDTYSGQQMHTHPTPIPATKRPAISIHRPDDDEPAVSNADAAISDPGTTKQQIMRSANTRPTSATNRHTREPKIAPTNSASDANAKLSRPAEHP